MLRRFIFSFLFFITFISSATAKQTILVFAASSMTLPLNEIVSEYKKHSTTQVNLAFGASSSLARQLLQGAPAQIYISANQNWMNFVENNKLIQTRKEWLTNRLVLVSQQNSPKLESFSLSSLQQGLKGQYLAMADPSHVPLGIYSKELLEHYGIWQSLANHIAFTRNARATLALVERGESPFGIVYYSDAIASKKIHIQYQFSNEKYSPILYSKALIKRVDDQASDFYQYLDSDEAKQIFIKYGFTLTEN